MRPPGRKASVYAVVFVLFLITFAFLLLTYTRRVDGRSMYPTLEEGDLVIILPSSVNDIHVGDVIVYGPPCSNGGISVIHRVIAIRPAGFVTQGDNNPAPDQNSSIALSPVYQDCVVGKVVFVVPYLERLASLPYGLNYALAILILLLILFSELSGKQSRDNTAVEGKQDTPASVEDPPTTNRWRR